MIFNCLRLPYCLEESHFSNNVSKAMNRLKIFDAKDTSTRCANPSLGRPLYMTEAPSNWLHRSLYKNFNQNFFIE